MRIRLPGNRVVRGVVPAITLATDVSAAERSRKSGTRNKQRNVSTHDLDHPWRGSGETVSRAQLNAKFTHGRRRGRNRRTAPTTTAAREGETHRWPASVREPPTARAASVSTNPASDAGSIDQRGSPGLLVSAELLGFSPRRFYTDYASWLAYRTGADSPGGLLTPRERPVKRRSCAVRFAAPT